MATTSQIYSKTLERVKSNLKLKSGDASEGADAVGLCSANTIKCRKWTKSVTISHAHLYVFRSTGRLKYVAKAKRCVDLLETRFCTYLKVSHTFVHSSFVLVPQTP